MPLADALRISIGLDSVPVSSQGMGITLFLSKTAAFSERLRYYSSAQAVLDDPDAGFTTSSPEYLAAQVAFSQRSPRPPSQIAIGRLSTLVARVRQINITGSSDGVYSATLNQRGVEKVATFTAAGNTPVEIRDGLQASIDALQIDDADFVTATAAGVSDISIAADVAGADFTLSVDGPGAPDIQIDAATTEPVGVVAGLGEIMAIDSTGWYAIDFPAAEDALNYDLAVVTETLEKICGVTVTGANPVDPAKTEDLLSRLMALSLVRCVPCYHSDGSGNGRFMSAAILANRLANDPDETSTIFAFAELPLIPVDTFADSTATAESQQTALEGKNGNYYAEDGAGGEFYPGTAPGGQWLDLVITRDWFTFRLLERFKTLRKGATNRGSKVPMTDAGFSLYESEFRAQADIGIQIDHFSAEPPYIVNMPTRATIPTLDITNRVLRFSFNDLQPASAVQGVSLSGDIAVAV